MVIRRKDRKEKRVDSGEAMVRQSSMSDFINRFEVDLRCVWARGYNHHQAYQISSKTWPTEIEYLKEKKKIIQQNLKKKSETKTLGPPSLNTTLISTLYGQPKIHKPSTPLWPIISSTGSATHKITSTIAKILTPITRHMQILLNSIEILLTNL